MRQLSNYRRVRAYDEASVRLFGAMISGGGQLSDSRRALIDLTIRRLKDQALWDKLDCLYMFAALDSASALINWKVPGTFNCTNVSATAFTADLGFIGDGAADYIDTGYTPSTAAGVFVQDSAHISGWSLTSQAASAGTTNRLFGNTGATTPRATLATRNTGDTFTGRLNCANDGWGASSSTDSSGFFVYNRSANNAQQIYRNGASVATSTTASTGLSTSSIGFLRDQPGSAFGTLRVGCGTIGSSLSATDVAALYAVLLAHMQGVGAV